MLINTSHFIQSVDVFPYAGEIILLVGILFSLIHFTFQEAENQGNKVQYSALIAYSSRVSAYILILVLVFYVNLLYVYNGAVLGFFHGALILNNEVLTFKAVLVFLGILILLVSETYFKNQAGAVGYFEYNILLLASLLGALITLSANDMLIFYISLEIQALAFYIMATMKKTSASSEAGLKYFIVGSFSSALLLFGISLIVLLTGHYNFDSILLFDIATSSSFTNFGALLIITALLIKLAVAPFHAWVADVYEGIMTPTALLFATIPKITNFFILVRLSQILDTQYTRGYLTVVCLLSLIFGCLYALKQQNIKRFLAFSSVNHFGFIFMGFPGTVEGSNGIEASFFYLSFYIILTFGLWTGLLAFGNRLTRITQLGFLLNRNAGITFAFLLMLLSTGGIPPLAGFNAKISVFYALLDPAVLDSLSVLILFTALLSSILSVYYYLRVIKILTFTTGIATVFAQFPLHPHCAEYNFRTANAVSYVLAAVTAFNLFGFILLL